MKEVEVSSPFNTNGLLARSAEGAREEKMEGSLLHVDIAKFTVIIVAFFAAVSPPE